MALLTPAQQMMYLPANGEEGDTVSFDTLAEAFEHQRKRKENADV